MKTSSFHRADATGNLICQVNDIHWENTDAINRVRLQPTGYSTHGFIANSVCQLVGIKTES